MLSNFITRIGWGLALFIEREAGHGLISMALILTGLLVIDAQSRAAVGHDMVAFGLGVLSRSMGAGKGNQS